MAGGVGIMSMDYLGGFQYQGTALKFFPTAEGYVQATALKVGFAYSYVYNYTDHLGNIRLSYAQDPENPNVLKILEESHYYPFGLKHTNYNSDQLAFKEKDPGPGLMLMAAAAAIDPVPQFVYNYKYNGKEFQDEMGMNWYDYGARNYDHAIGRWMNIDPLAEKSRKFSPYAYALDNPVSFIDPDGMEATPPDWYIDNRSGKILGQDGAATNNYRLIDGRDFDQIKNANGGSTTNEAATSQLQNTDVSTLITINDAQIQQEAQTITDLSRTNENQTQIVLDKFSGKVSAKRDTAGRDGSADINSSTSQSGATIAADGVSLLIGVIHGHNKIQKAEEVNVTGTSAQDTTAASLGITIYETDAYNTPVGGSANVGRVTSSGDKKDNVGQTKGRGEGTFNFGLDALNNLPR